MVKPLRFPGGSIGELAVNGTVNDLAVSGARAQALVVTYVLEAGLPTEILEAEVRAMAHGGAPARSDDRRRRHQSGGARQGRLACTSPPRASAGRYPGIALAAASVRPGDKVLLSGPIGDHGITILLARGELELEAELCSDTRSVLPLVEALARVAAPGIRWMRDPTRGGVATSLNELARDCGLGVMLWEDAIPIRDTVRGACELLGLDPLHIANEGQFLAVVAPEYADAALAGLATTRPADSAAAIIGEIREEPAGTVLGANALRRHPRHRHAGGRSVAAHMLSRYRHFTLASHVEKRLLERNRTCEEFFAREAPRLAFACREMSDRFLQGGRLLAFGRGPYATDAQHVSVEFVHPVIVGKRALPALDLSMLFGPWLEAIVQPEDIVMGFGPPEGDPEVQAALDAAAARGAMTFALPGARGRILAVPRRSDPFIHQEMIEILYHTLWETVHVFFEHRELGHDVGDAGFPLSVSGARETADRRALVDEVAASIRMKVADDAKLREQTARGAVRTNREYRASPFANA